MRDLSFNSAVPRLNWNYSPEDYTLSGEEVHVWVASLDDESHARDLATTLSSDEKERAARFHFQRDRKHFVAARGVLRAILSGYTRTPATSLRFGYGKNGKPHLADAPDFDNLNFNLSHSDGLALYAVTRNRALGIDLENVRSFPDMNEIAARCFSPKEKETLQFLDGPQKNERFFRFWTRNEAQLKCIGEGFSDQSDALQKFEGLIQELEPAEGYIATLAVCGKPFTLKTFLFRFQSRAPSPSSNHFEQQDDTKPKEESRNNQPQLRANKSLASFRK
ncbi:MAG: 4'-phosphopantetheinyl transferase superfamily protein [Verrucomicrobiota bacterium]